ncbi:hypothetical protein K4L44_08815 [Halosquirtibacter laminarini]|uniref:Uncharacterized protein n=1 Tax=Halosquirtibacter laminarini TaxID=3374600 RepID=A0AC61NPI3_9BACT|nr:hypothetical protein K4L44_08815 [Prolixibacteraceae bacterium]
MLTESEKEELRASSEERRLELLEKVNRKGCFVGIFIFSGIFLFIIAMIYFDNTLRKIPNDFILMGIMLFMLVPMVMALKVKEASDKLNSYRGDSGLSYRWGIDMDVIEVRNYSSLGNSSLGDSSHQANFLYIEVRYDGSYNDEEYNVIEYYEYLLERIYTNEYENNQHMKIIESFVKQFKNDIILELDAYEDTLNGLLVKKIPLEECVKEYCMLPVEE